MTAKKRKRIIVAMIAFVAIAVIAIVPGVLYSYGLLPGVHHMNKPKDGQIRVACVGDSLTYGYGIENSPQNNYPTQLGKMLGSNYCVNNFGYSGRTASSFGDRPYVKEKLYEKSLAYSPEIVVVMLGSNDTKPKNWKDKETFKEEYRRIIKSYLDLDSVKKVFILAPTPVCNANGKTPFGVRNELVKNDVREVGRELSLEFLLRGVSFIDLYKEFDGKPELFSDGAHPTARGAKMIADIVYRAISGWSLLLL